MPDLTMSVVLTRDNLGLGPLDANDGVAYKASGANFLGATASWNRSQITSPFIDGAFTVSRQRQQVMEPVAFEVYGRTIAGGALDPGVLQTNMAALLAAFSQDSFTLTITIDSVVYAYAAEAADYQLTWVGPRFMARQGAVQFTMPRQPVPLIGAV